ncbi:MAG: BMP family ABC transporter substrate-binding protein, partial [Chloroflexota bacterium]
MKKTLFTLLSGLMLASLVLTACGGGATTAAPTQATAPTAVPATQAPTQPPAPTGKVCEVTDVGGVDDKSFNQTAWNGAQTGAQDAGWEAAVLESQQQTDYEKNINEFVQSKCDLIVTVGFLLGDATAAAVTANPDQKFMILDVGYLPESPNLLQQTYAVEQAAFLAGYVAASFTKTGKVGTFGGINIPPVVDFMVG